LSGTAHSVLLIRYDPFGPDHSLRFVRCDPHRCVTRASLHEAAGMAGGTPAQWSTLVKVLSCWRRTPACGD